jgi:hypothetical protein
MTTKKTTPVQEILDEYSLSAIEDTAPTVENNDRWNRQSALEFALTFQKNNGGMHQADQVVKTAQIFFEFIKGETK